MALMLEKTAAGINPIDRSRYQQRRRTFLANHVDVTTTRGLEFGGFDLPTVPQPFGDCAIADMRSEVHLSREFDIPLDEISFVDCIVEPGLAAYRQILDQFDYVILCHVLEHIPDVITMINDLGELLVPGGVLFIALPDKRETPDASRNSTTLSRLVERQLDHASKPSLSEIVEFALAWNEDFQEQYEDSMRDFFHAMRSHQLFGNPDVHCNVWRDDEFIGQLRDLIRGGYVTDLKIIGIQATEKPFKEFYVALRRALEPNASASTVSRAMPRRVHYRTCNFCGFGQFKVWKRIHSPFPEKLYSDSTPDPELGRELSLQYLTCRHCDLTSINPLPDFDIVDRHRFSAQDALRLGKSEITHLIEDRERVTEILSGQYDFDRYRQNGRLLDVSCGPGIGLAWLRDHRGWKVSGVEPAREFVEFASRRFGIEVFNGLVQDLPEPSESFDIIIIDSSLQYMFDPLGTLITCHRLLREGGCLFIQAPNRDGLGPRWIDLNVQWGHWFFYTADVLHRVLGRIGFRSEQILAFQNPIEPRVSQLISEDKAVAQETLEVALRGHAEIQRYFESDGNLHADFFGISARKLPDSERLGDADAIREALQAVSRVSGRQRICVAVDPETDVIWPWERSASGRDTDTHTEDN